MIKNNLPCFPLISFVFLIFTLLNLLACSSSSNSANGQANNNAPTFNSGNSFIVSENSIAVSSVTAIDSDGDTIIYSISGGADQGLFIINSTTAALNFSAPQDYENPGDSDSNNIYLVEISAYDGTTTVSQSITITVTNINDVFPVFTSATNASFEENTSRLLTAQAADIENDSISYSLTGGLDQALFTIDNDTGTLSFINPPDFETPADSDLNNIYLVQLGASDGVNITNQSITITITDLNEVQFGLSSRPSNTSCIIPDAPVISSEIQLTRVFANLSFLAPVALRQLPTDPNRWYVVEQDGLIKTFLSNDSSATNFIDLTSRIIFNPGFGDETGLLGMAFHPDFAVNNFVYLYYSTPGGSLDHQSVISRFTATNATTLDPSSEQILLRIDQPYGNHNGGNILFGPDGYLYIGMGDGGSGGDPEDNAQNINSLLGKMLRIDVDNPDLANGTNYSSPTDNPYFGIPGLDEIYALGLRHPWRWSFDRLTGDLIAGDVGQNAWEEIDIITRGGNYGWRCYEGEHTFNTSGCLAQSSYISPIYEYAHGTGSSITGGYVYRGSAIPALNGTYLYSDYFIGPIWGISDPTGQNPVNNTVLQTTGIFISSFAEDNTGELYVLSYSYTDGQIFRIEPATGSATGSFPALLSDTGCLDSNNPLQMASGLIPYEINVPFWSDDAIKDRWMALPDGSGITIEQNNDWTFPNNSVLVKNFSINNKRIETRLLVRHADGNWGGYSYEWNDNETDASLVLNGKTTTKEGQTYIFPSSTQCMLCHTTVAGIALGPETNQLNRDTTYPSTGLTANQLATLDHIGLFTNNLTDIPENLPRLKNPLDTSATIDERARAYLYTNCAQCHRQGGPTNVNLDFDIHTLDSDMNICNAAPTHQIGDANYIMSPGNASDSTMYLRMNCRNGDAGCNTGDQMPPLGSAYVDTSGASILSTWINSINLCP